MYILILLLSFYLLAVICDEFFVPALDVIIDRLKLNSDVAGATFMAVGSSAPELFTSLFAVLKPGEHANIGAGTIVGSAIFNILVIIGASALFKRAKLNWQPVVRDTLFYCLSIIMLLIAFWDGKIVLTEALYFAALYIGYVFSVVQWGKWFPYEDTDPIEIIEDEVHKSLLTRTARRFLSIFIPDAKKHPNKYILSFTMAIVLISALSYSLVESAVAIGEVLHINPTIIALTVLAAGTSIPDLLSSMIVAKRGRGDMAVSNAVGSNIFDILFGLGAPWIVVLVFTDAKSIVVANENLISSVILLFATVVAVFVLLVARNWVIGRKAGLLLIGSYVLYVMWNISQVV